MLAPGANISVVRPDQKVRVPFFVVSVKDTPSEFLQDKPAIISKLKERIFGSTTNPSDSLQGYYNHLFDGKLSFFDPADVIPLDLGGNVGDYFHGSMPTRRLFEDVKEALSHTDIPLEVYNNKQLNGQANDATSLEDELDLVVIFVIGRSDKGMWPLRGWYEWTGDGGSQAGLGSESALPLTDAKSHKTVKLSNYCVMPVFGKEGQNDIIGYNFLAHEMLHAFGLPDLYDRTNQSAGCGGWCCMGWGLYGGVRAVDDNWSPQWNMKPVWPSAWCRQFLGIERRGIRQRLTPAEGDAELESPLNDHGKPFFRIDLPGRSGPLAGGPKYQRYLLVEFRGPGLEKDGTFDWDEELPAAGFLIWEISENVGRFGLSNKENTFWPCVFGSDVGQNDVDGNPLVGLWRPSSQTLRNLEKTEILQREQLWSQDDQVFKHPDGVILSHFRQNGKSGILHYRIEVTTPSPAPSPPTIASVSEAPTPLQEPPPPQPAATVTEAVGTPQDLVSTKLPAEVSGQLKNVFAAYPRLDHSITTQDNEVKSVVLPASVKSKKAFAKDVASHVDLLNGKLLGDSRARIISPTPAPQATPAKASMTNLFKGTQELAKNIGVKIGDQNVRVAGSHVDIQRQEKGVRYSFSNPLKLPALPKTLPTSFSQAAVTQFFQARFRDAIPKNAVVELVIENKTGKLKWQCHVPTVPTSGPVTIEIDAGDPNGLSDKTAILIK